MPTTDGVVDLRSDTVTRPGPDMRAAIAAAEVGDDVYGEDPTVRALEETVADRFGRQAALFVPTGTMANQIALRLTCPPASEVLLDADAHLVTYEGAAAALLSGIQTRTIVNPRGLLDPDQVEAQLRPITWHVVATRAVSVENTHNRGGGAVYPMPTLQRLRELTAARGVALHCDGARIWNAHVATGVPLQTYGELFDVISVCLSKGLGAPVGSLVICDADRYQEAREFRHRFGGAWRQAGILAAAGLYALRHHVDRLADDHDRAQRLARALAEAVPGVCDPAEVESNIVLLDLRPAGVTGAELEETARAEGVLVAGMGDDTVRLVTHLDVDDAGCARAIEVLTAALDKR
ncbi:MAG: aminotransferase class I/II-fold pyridoxal phosphate-dependent enzyme [Sporichthyaceae bacterium]|nr:aminotransferase class I/II-fold pyridoxal phosphate-dependent enzyme [Sporichthyaceae bacterium]